MAVLTKYRSLLTSSRVQLTYVAICFQLQGTLRRTLEEHGVTVTAAVEPESLIPLQAAFRFKESETTPGTPVVIIDESVGVISQRSVNWGDGESSDFARGNSHIYQAEGRYVVTFEVSSGGKRKATASREVKVTAPIPQASFTMSSMAIDCGGSVDFVNKSQGTDLKYQWDFGDGQTSTEINPRVKFATAGQFNVQLTAKNKYGRSHTCSTVVTVSKAPPPIASIAGPSVSRIGDELRAFDRSTGVIQAWTWYVDGTRVSTDRDLTFKPATVGTHRVRLEVSGPGGSDSIEIAVDVKSGLPPLEIVGPATGEIGERLNFLGRSGDERDKYRWSVAGAEVGQSPDLKHAFSVAGRQELVLEVVGPSGSRAVSSWVSISRPPAPVIDARVPITASVGESIDLVDRTSGRIDSWVWSVDKEQISNQRDARFIPRTAGTCLASLSVVSPGGASSKEWTIAVAGPEPPNCSFVIGSHEPRAGELIRLTDTSSGRVDLASWFVPGQAKPMVRAYAATDSKTIDVELPAGDQEIRLVVVGPGGERQATQRVNVLPRYLAPIAKISVDQDSGRGSLRVSFLNSSTGTVERTEFDFGDGSPVKIVQGAGNIDHPYSVGEFVAIVRVYGPAGLGPAVTRIPITVAKPLPRWLSYLWWLAPLLCPAAGEFRVAVVCLAALTVRREPTRFIDRRGPQLQAERPADGTIRTIHYREIQIARLRLSDSIQANIQACLDPATNEVDRDIELVDLDGNRSGRVRLPENERVVVGDYEFNLVHA